MPVDKRLSLLLKLKFLSTRRCLSLSLLFMGRCELIVMDRYVDE